MKKYILIIILLLHGINKIYSKPKFGVIGDMNLSKIYITDAKTDIDWMSSTVYHFGFSFGATSKFCINKTLNLKLHFFILKEELAGAI